MTASIYFHDLLKLEYIKEGNQLPNLKWFLEEVFNKHTLLTIFEEWSKKKTETTPTREWFEHEMGTLLLNAKFYAKYSMFGMKYGGMACTTYVNNTKPNLLEFFAIDSL